MSRRRRSVDETEVLVDEPVPGPPGPPLEEPPPNRELWPWLLLLLVLVLGGIAAAWLLTRDDNGKKGAQTTTQAQTVAPLPRTTVPTPAPTPTTHVPSLVGRTAPEALVSLRKAGLTGTTRNVFSNKARNRVVGQDPAPSTEVKKGSAVVIKVSKGPQSIPVPDATGQSAADALATLKAAGFRARIVRVPSAEPAGTVVAQNPRPGAKATPGSEVRLNVSGGSPTPTTTAAATTTAPAATTTAPATTAPTTTAPAVPASVRVPDVTGMKLLAARRAIRRAGLVTEFKQVPSTEPRGTVVSQSPKPGQTRKRGDHVLVNVSRGPATAAQQGSSTTVPDVTGQDEASASQDLEAAGYTVRTVDRPTSDPSEDGIVLSQSPAPGQTARANSQVTINVGRYGG